MHLVSIEEKTSHHLVILVHSWTQLSVPCNYPTNHVTIASDFLLTILYLSRGFCKNFGAIFLNGKKGAKPTKGLWMVILNN